MNFLTHNWPLILLISWFVYRWLNTRVLKKKLPDFKRNGAILLDVRSSGEFQVAHARDSINIPLNELSHRLQELPKGTTVLVACASGTRSGMARLLLKRHGFKNVYNFGNWSNMESP